jgi:ABC-2 type transport system ATP-binding protein
MLTLHNLSKEFGSFVAVDDLNVTVPEGEIYGLIGPNGAGKTTTIRMACGLLAPTSGTVTIAGVNVQREPERVQQFIGYLSDVYSVYEDLKVWEYLDYFAHAYKMAEAEIPDRIGEVIDVVGLEVKRDELIKGLSRGMKQRLGLARSILHRPRVLLLDEPASGLDPKARLNLRTLLLSLRREGTTILISSHILSELEGFCTSIGIMERGRMIRSGLIRDITTGADPSRVICLKCAGTSIDHAAALLGGMMGVSEVRVEETECWFSFSGSDEGVAEVLAQLVSGGIQVIFFGEVKKTVEDLYMQISHHEVM